MRVMKLNSGQELWKYLEKNASELPNLATICCEEKEDEHFFWSAMVGDAALVHTVTIGTEETKELIVDLEKLGLRVYDGTVSSDTINIDELYDASGYGTQIDPLPGRKPDHEN